MSVAVPYQVGQVLLQQPSRINCWREVRETISRGLRYFLIT